MHTLALPRTSASPLLLTVDVHIVPIASDGLDLTSARLERVRRGWKLVLTPDELGSDVRFRVHTDFLAADIPYRLIKIKLAGGTQDIIGPIFEIQPPLVAGDDLTILDLTAAAQADQPQPKRRGGGSILVRDAGGGL